MIASLITLACIADPSIIAIGDWVIAEKASRGWRSPGKSLHGKKVIFKSWRGDHAEDDYFGELEYDAGPPMPSVTLKDFVNPGPEILFASGKATFAPVTRISPENLEYRKIASYYAVKLGHKHSVKISDGIQADLDGDGRREVLLVLNATDINKPKSGFCALLLRQLSGHSGSKVKTTTLEMEGKYGYMRGPFKAQIFGAGDLDGDGKREFVYSISDPWGVEAKLVQLRNGKVKTLCSTGMGE